MKTLVFDTSILIDSLRGSPLLRKYLTSLEKGYGLVIPTIVVLELYSGQSSKKELTVKKIENVLKYFEIVDLSKVIAQRAGELYRDYNLRIDTRDLIIAATALEIGGEVVTLNKKHFQKIPGVRVFGINQ